MKFPHLILSLSILWTVILPCVASITANVPNSARRHGHISQYDGVAVLRIPHTSPELDALIAGFGLRTWARRGSWVDVQVPRGVYERFLGEVGSVLGEGGAGADVLVMHSDLGDSLRAESGGIDRELEKRGGEEEEVMMVVQAEKLSTQSWFNSYHAYDEHLKWLEDLVSSFPNNSKIVSSGTSFEGRDIKGVHIFGEGGAGTKPAVIWHGNVHAREWITTMTVEYLAYSLLNNYANSTDVKGVVDKFDYYIFPNANPDGFVYTQTADRMWRKNRQPPPSKNSDCFGRNLNRNWDISFSFPPDGASTDPCHEEYKGESPHDAPEVEGLANFIDNKAREGPGAVMYVDWHSYGMLFMYPYAYDCAKTLTPADTAEFDRLVQGFAQSVYEVHSANYGTGPICKTLYPVSGSSSDYTFDVSKIKYSFSAELRENMSLGFVLPPSLIRISGEETWEGVMYLLKNIVPPGSTPTPSPTASTSSRLRREWLGLVMVVLMLVMQVG